MDEQLYVDVGDVLKHDGSYYLVDGTLDEKNKTIYFLIQIYPLTSLMSSIDVTENEIKDFKVVFKSSEENEFKDLLKAIIDDIKNKVGEMSENQKSAAKKNRFLQNDVIHYDKIGDIDTCLDAINDLKLLHQMFGDEAYLQLIEVVEKRLKELVKKIKGDIL